jgi:dihydroorotate dehydrogenase electron transfer subunit
VLDCAGEGGERAPVRIAAREMEWRMPEDHLLRIESNRHLGASYHLLTLASGADLPAWAPGQFAMISLGERSDPLLRRPFSIYNLHSPGSGRTVQALYKILGRGTSILAGVRSGDALACLLPLGRGFSPAREGGEQLVLVAGGVGIASLHPLAAAEVREGRSPLLLYGCRSAEEIAGAAPTREVGIETLVATDDGSFGHQGLVTDLLDATLRERGSAGRILCACGPTPMMKATAEVARRHRIRCYLSLESSMACGFGVCVGCVVGSRRTGGGTSYVRTCVEGTVMDAAEIVW